MSIITIRREYFEIEIVVEETVDELGNLPIEIEVRCIKDIEPFQSGDFCNAGDMNFFLANGVFLDDMGEPCVKNLYVLLGTLALCAEEWMIKGFIEDMQEGAWRNKWEEVCTND